MELSGSDVGGGITAALTVPWWYHGDSMDWGLQASMKDAEIQMQIVSLTSQMHGRVEYRKARLCVDCGKDANQWWLIIVVAGASG